jgi:hypothetical protein
MSRKKGAVRFCVFAIKDYVSARNHFALPVLRSATIAACTASAGDVTGG